jgi:hypothetical protein
MNLLYITLLVPRALMSFPNFWAICAPLGYSKMFTTSGPTHWHFKISSSSKCWNSANTKHNLKNLWWRTGEIVKLFLELTDNQPKSGWQWLLRQSRHVYTQFSTCTYMLMCSMCSFSQKCVLWQVHSLFQSEFSRDCDLLLPLTIFTILSFPSSCLRRLPVSSILLSLSFSNIFQKATPTQDVTNPVNLPLFYCM